MAKTVVEFRLDELFQVLKEEFSPKRRAKQDMESIRGEVESIRAFLGHIDDKKLELEYPSLESWVKKVRDVAYEVEDVVDHFLLSIFDHRWDEGRAHTPPSCSFIGNCKTNCHICCVLRSIKAKVRRIAEEPKKCEVSSVVPEGNRTIRRFQGNLNNMVDISQLVGPRDLKESLIDCLTDDSTMNKVIAIVAEGGMGKSALACQIYHDYSIRGCFEKIAFVTISQSLNEEELLRDMILQLGSVDTEGDQFHTMNKRELKETFKGSIQSSRYLIVLDDVWGKEHWDCVKVAFPNNQCASRVLITTRNEEVARYATTNFDLQGNIFQLQRLSESDSWELFCQKTFSSQSCPSHLEHICKRMVEKCEGLPLAILVLSGLLGTKNKNKVEEWVMVQCVLNNIELGGNIFPRLNTVLSLAFDDLPHHLKPCFLLLSVFPQNHLIEPMRLVRLWVSDGSNKIPEEVAEGYLYELLNRNLIQIAKYTLDGRIMCFRIHDLVHETIVLKSKEINFAEAIINKENARNWPERGRRLSVHEGNADVSEIKGILLSRLRSLFLFQTHSSTISNLRGGHFKLLNVLDLKGTPLETFPEDITKLFLLKYLSLRNTRISSLPASIGNLHHLETLDLKLTRVTELPSEISKLYKLRHLLISQYRDSESGSRISPDGANCGIKWKNYHNNLTHVTKLDIFRVQGFKATSAIGCLVSLQKLSIVEAPNEAQGDFMEKGLGMLTQLRRLCLVNLQKHHWSALCSSISKMRNLRSLSLTTSGKFELQNLRSPPPLLERMCLVGELDKLPSWVCSLENLKAMKLVGTRLKEDPGLCLEKLHSLEVIGLYDALEDGVTLRMSSDFRDRVQWFILGDHEPEVY